MRRIAFHLMIAGLCIGNGFAQQAAPAQTARQALVEMFFSKAEGTFVKHLPVATRTALEKSGSLASLQQYSVMATQLQAQGGNVQTFDTGSVLLSADDPKASQKVEITVESDALRGDQDDIDIAFHIYKNGQEQRTPFMPQMTFSMKQEERVWKLNEISVTIHVPLADPDLLKAITEKMAPQTAAHSAMVPRTESAGQPTGSDAMVLAAMQTILTAETTYASRYPGVGYTCSLSNLDGFGGGEPSARQAMLISSSLASGKRYGFVFNATDCEGSPATSFRLTATPNVNNSGRKAFCADQTGVIRSSDDGNAASCLASGKPIQ